MATQPTYPKLDTRAWQVCRVIWCTARTQSRIPLVFVANKRAQTQALISHKAYCKYTKTSKHSSNLNLLCIHSNRHIHSSWYLKPHCCVVLKLPASAEQCIHNEGWCHFFFIKETLDNALSEKHKTTTSVACTLKPYPRIGVLTVESQGCNVLITKLFPTNQHNVLLKPFLACENC